MICVEFPETPVHAQFNRCSTPLAFTAPLLLILILLASLFASGCGLFGTHKKVQVPQLLTPLAEADTARLISEVNRLAAVRSVMGKIDIVFEDTSFAEAGIAEKYARLTDRSRCKGPAIFI